MLNDLISTIFREVIGVASLEIDTMVKTEADAVARIIGSEMDRVQTKFISTLTILLLGVVSFFFLSLGVAQVVDAYSPVPGTGYVLVGILLLLLTLAVFITGRRS